MANDDVVHKSLGNTFLIFTKCILQISNGRPNHYCRGMNHSKNVLQACSNLFKSRKQAVHDIHCISSDRSMFSINLYTVWHFSQLKEKKANGCSLRYNMRSDYLLCIHLGNFDGIPNTLQVLISPNTESF